MNPNFPRDPMLTRLNALPVVTQDRESVARIRARCQAALVKPHQSKPAGRGFRALVVDGTFVVVSVVYLSGAVAQAWRLFSALR